VSVQVRAFLTHTSANRIDTEYLQEGLTKLGYHPGPVDGRFAIGTLRAVVAFQNDAGVEPNGFADPATWEAFEKALAPPKKAAVPKATEAPPKKAAAPKRAAPKQVPAKESD
jgi:peptidoglycan hydrolase-like protein with peptidoglycan-binding domain